MHVLNFKVKVMFILKSRILEVTIAKTPLIHSHPGLHIKGKVQLIFESFAEYSVNRESVSISTLFHKKLRLACQRRMSLSRDKLKLCFVKPFGKFGNHVAERLDVLSKRK